MKVIPVQSLKGGTGKTQICVGIGRALKKLGYTVGFLDLDWIAPNLHLQLGLESDIQVELADGVGDRIRPVISAEGFPILSSTFIFPPDQAISMDETAKINDIREIITDGVVDWGELDYLIMDTPPTTSQFIRTALTVPHLQGVVLVVQPAVSAMADLMRTLSLIEEQQIPVLGLVANQVYLICPHGEQVNLYELTGEHVHEICHEKGIPFLGSVPHIPNTGGHQWYDITLAHIAKAIVTGEPVYLKPEAFSSVPYKLLMALAKRRKRSKEGTSGGQDGTPKIQ